MMDLPLSGVFGSIKAIISYFKDGFEKLLFYRAYEISTLYHTHRRLLGRFPKKLTDDLEFDINFEKYYFREPKSSPLFWLKALNEKSFSKVVLSVTASNDKIKYQDTLIFYDVNSIPIQASLPSIPFHKLNFKTGFENYEHIVTKVLEIQNFDGNPIKIYGTTAKILSPLERYEVALGLEKDFVEKWGSIFNLQFIEMEIREESIRLIGSMFASPKLIYDLKKFIFGKNWIVKISFWWKNIIFAKQLNAEFNKYWQEQQELDKWRREKTKQ